MLWKRSTASEGKPFSFPTFHLGKQQWILCLLVGMLLAVIAMPVKETKHQKTGTGQTALFSREEAEQDSEKQQLERELESLLASVEGVGEVQVMLTVQEIGELFGERKAEDPQVTGVLIAAAGAGDFLVVQEIQEAVQALFQVEAHKIKVMKMK